MNLKRIFAAIIIIVIIIFSGTWLKDFLIVDDCLDSGGRWNYETEECEYSNRIERVNSLPYRNMNLDDSLRSKVEIDILNLAPEVESPMELFYLVDEGWFKEVGEWEDLTSLRNDSYEKWRDGNIRATMIIFPTQITDAITNESRSAIGVEFEHTEFTGTAFYELSPDKQRLVTFNYFERN